MFGRDFGLFSHCSPLGRYWMGFGRPEKLRAHVLQVTKVSMTTSLAHIEPRLWSWPNFSQIWENLNFCRQSVQKLTDSTQHSESSWNIEIGTMAKQCTLEPWPTELFFLFCMCLSFGTKFGRIQWGWFFFSQKSVYVHKSSQALHRDRSQMRNIENGSTAKQCTLEPWPTKLFF